MAKLQHQHFIPKSYLKNFAVSKDKSYLVEAKRKGESEPKKKLLSTRDICVSKNLYTLSHKEGDERYALETYYAEEIDKVYPEIYGWLTDANLTKITAEQRGKIIMTSMSLFFRTPKFLNLNQRMLNTMLDYAIRNFKDKNGNVKCRLENLSLDFNVKDIDEVRERIKLSTKLEFLQNHLKNWHEFIKFKLRAAIVVTRLYDDSELITSDNPVIMHSVNGNRFNVFDPTNMISLPLDNKHYLMIYPNTEEAMLDTIYRTERDNWFSLTTNLQVEQSSEDWIFGKPGSVYKHISDQLKYNAETPENIQAVTDMARRAKDGMELAKIMEVYGFPHQKVADKVKEMLSYKIHREDREVLNIAHRLKEFGFSTE